MPVTTTRRTVPADGGAGTDPGSAAGLLALAPPKRLNSVNPIFTYRGSGELAGQVMEPCVLVDPKDSTRLIMYFCGERHGGTGGANYRMTAPTANPKAWTPYGGWNPTPVLNRGAPGTWDDSSMRVDSVIYDPVADRFNMYYTGQGTTTAAFQVGLATSAGTDGLTFTKHASNPVFTPGAVSGITATDVSQFAVLRVSSSSWYAFYTHRGSDGTNTNVRIATSSDGVAWTDTGTVAITKGAGGTYDSTYIEWHQISAHPDGTLMLVYECFDGIHWRAGIATATTPTGPWTKYAGNPIFEGSGLTGTFDEVHIATPAIFRLNGKWYLFYCGTDNLADYIVGYWSLGMALF